MKKDRKIILVLLGIELLLLVVMTAIAAHTVSTGADAAHFDRADSRVLQAVSHIRQKLFPHSGILNAYGQHFTPIGPSPAPGDTVTTPPAADPYTYYTFHVTDSGFTTTRVDGQDGLDVSGIVTSASENALIIPRSKSYYQLGSLRVTNNYVPVQLDMREILQEPLKLRKLPQMGAENAVVLYYTHTSEAYCRDEADQYNVTGYATSSDTTRNVVYAGTVMQQYFAQNGISAVNDQTVHDSGMDSLIAYDLGEQTLTRLLRENPNTQLVMDIHRDGIDPVGGKRYGPLTTCNGTEYAQISFVVGMDYDDNYNRGPELNPYWKENFKLAMLLIEKLEARVPGITRGITLRRTPYNQHLATNTLLVEIGFDGNLVSQAAVTAELLATVLTEVYS